MNFDTFKKNALTKLAHWDKVRFLLALAFAVDFSGTSLVVWWYWNIPTGLSAMLILATCLTALIGGGLAIGAMLYCASHRWRLVALLGLAVLIWQPLGSLLEVKLWCVYI